MTFKTIKKHPAIQQLSSLKLTVLCLTILAILVVWGTVYQAENGLYQAQQKFFHSWFFLLLGFVPFPGTNLVMFVLLVNLVGSIIFKIGFRWQKSGSLLIHLGIIVLLAGGFISSQTSFESVLTIKEGQETNLSSAYHDWEVAVWLENSGEGPVYAVDAAGLKSGDEINFSSLGITIQIKTNHENCQAFVNQNSAVRDNIISSSGIVALKPRKNDKTPARNTPGLIFSFLEPVGLDRQILLFANDPQPSKIVLNKKTITFYLRKKRFQLPFSLKLLDFKKLLHPGSKIAKSYESRVEIRSKNLNREVRISMNKPLRYKDYAFFQSSYFVDRQGNEYSVLAVVKNAVRLFPYFASGIIFLGMVLHFIMALWVGFRKKKNENQSS